MPTPEDVPMEEADSARCAEGSQDEGATPSPEELKKIIAEIDKSDMIENEWWYLVDQKWWNALNNAVHNAFPDDIERIDNTHISECRGGKFYLKQRLVERVDYMVLPEKLFKRLEHYYHVDDERRDYIRRQVIKKNGQLTLEVYPRIVHIFLARNKDIKSDLVLKPDDDMTSLRDRVINELGLKVKDNVRFYVMNDDTPELIDTNKSVDSYFDTVLKVLVDVQKDGSFFIRPKNSPPQAKSDQSSLESENENEDEFTVRLPRPKSNKFSTSTVSSAISRALLPLWTLWLSFRELFWRFSQMWPDSLRQAVAFVFGWWILRPPTHSARLNMGSVLEKAALGKLMISMFKTVYGDEVMGKLENTLINALKKWGKRDTFFELIYTNQGEKEAKIDRLTDECVQYVCEKQLVNDRIRHTSQSLLALGSMLHSIGDYRVASECIWGSISLALDELIERAKLQVRICSHDTKRHFVSILSTRLMDDFINFETCHRSFFNDVNGSPELTVSLTLANQFIHELSVFEVTEQIRLELEKIGFKRILN